MDDEALDASEYYRDTQSFQSLRKRKSQLDSNNSLEPTSSNRNNAVELLPVVLQAKTDRRLKAYSPISIDNCLKNVSVQTKLAVL